MSKMPERVTRLSPAKRALLALELQSKLDAIDRIKAEPIAIIGLGCRFPGCAQGPESFWQLLREGVDAITEVPPERWDIHAYYDPDSAMPGKVNTRWGGFLDTVALFDANFFGISPREADRMDPQQRLLLEVSWEALEDACLAPERLQGTKTSVFIGIMANDYFRVHMNEPELIDVYAGTGNALSIAANRLSYFFDFRGPSLAIDTACSSSLMAVHLACQSLRNGESEMALAGGVNVILSPDNTIFYTQAGLMSPNGRCKSFDAHADGYIRSEGVGVVMLKPLSKAIADRNRIYAVIRGSAVNQNGRHSNGLTTPNQKSQEDVLREAYRQAGRSPGQVQYVEAMGLGTTLGDAIEAQALGAVMTSDRLSGEPCAIGSVKTNLGHLEAAAGMAGLIKVALSLKHQELPPSLHYTEPNPYIAFDELLLRVQQRLEPWPKQDHPALAGVSSSSFSGVNAHIVLEEAPPADFSGGSRPWHLLLLSAQTDSALETATTNLADYLRQHPKTPLADIAYTLQIGRHTFDHRRAIVCREIEDALTALEGLCPERRRTSFQKKRDHSVMLMFSGQGTPCLNSVRALYQSESIFKEHMDLCAEILNPQLEFDLRLMMEPIEEKGAEEASWPRRLEVSQSFLFVVEYALAKLWMALGVHPEGMIGYGIGEYVAACLAGVFSLPDALTLLVKRARMIQELPPKAMLADAMLAVPLSAEDLESLLDEQLSLAAIDRPNLCIVSGAPEAVARLDQLLRSRGIECERVRSTHDFPSRMIEPLRDDFRQLVESIERAAPQIPYLSNVTGKWISGDEATDPNFWVRQLCQTIRFAEAIGQVLTGTDRVFMEIGPGQELCSNVRLHPDYDGEWDHCVIPTLPGAGDQDSALYRMMNTLGDLWLAGVQIMWDAFYISEKRQCLSLPTYPFERQRYWFDAGENGHLPAPCSATDRKKDGISELAGNTGLHARPALATAYVAPRNDLERTIAQIWQDLLGIEQIGIHDDFLDLGGHSLSATRLFSRLRQIFQVEFPIRSMLQMRTVVIQADLVATIHWAVQEPQPQSLSCMPEGAAITVEVNREAQPAIVERVARNPGSAGRSQARLINESMEFSLFYFSSSAAEFNDDKYRLLLEGAKFADQHGFTAVWTPERHFHAFGGLYPNPSVLSSALAMLTERVRLRAGSVVLPLHNPIRVAEEWAVVDNLSRGRVDLAFARGWNPNDFALSPQNFADNKEVLFSQVQTVERLWRGESVKFVNGVGEEAGVNIYPLPQQREVRVWITCSGGQERFVETGMHGYNVLTALLFQPIEELAQKIAAYREARSRHGHDPRTGHVTLMLHTFVGEDLKSVRNQVRAPFIEYLKSSVNLWSTRHEGLQGLTEKEQTDLLAFAFERYFQTSALFGSPETCLATVKRLKEIGVDEIACLIDFGVETDAVLTSLHTLDRLRRLSNDATGKEASRNSQPAPEADIFQGEL